MWLKQAFICGCCTFPPGVVLGGEKWYSLLGRVPGRSAEEVWLGVAESARSDKGVEKDLHLLQLNSYSWETI